GLDRDRRLRPRSGQYPVEEHAVARGETPGTMVVWLGQVTEGLVTVIAAAIAPAAARRRKVGTGSAGSASALAGNPSRLMTTTVDSSARAGCRADRLKAGAGRTTMSVMAERGLVTRPV